MDRRASRGLAEPFERRELRRLLVGDRAPVPVADDYLDRRRERRDRERNGERRALVAAPATTQARECVRGCKDEAGDHVSGEGHVDELVPEVAVAEQCVEG